MSSPPPKHSLSSPTNTTTTPVLPTPSSSSSASEVTNQLKRDLEHQIAEKEKQLQESTSGIGKSVLARQITQLKDRLQGIDARKPNTQQQSHQRSSPVSPRQRPQSPLSAAEEDLSPATLEKLRTLERDLTSYRGLSPSLSSQRRDKMMGQRSPGAGLEQLPSPSTSTLLPPPHGHDSTSLLPLPPPPTGSTPTKRRSKVPNADRRNTDIEFATEIGQGLLIEVRKMQALLQEKEDQLKALEAQKADLERAAEAMSKQLRQKEENEERLKEESWNLELAKQELTLSVTELQQNLHRANAEQKRMAENMNDLTTEIEHMRDREEKMAATLEAMKQRHEHDMSTIRRHSAGLQREKADYAKQLEALSSELAIAKAQSRIAKRSHSELKPAASVDAAEEPKPSTSTPTKEGSTPGTTPPPSPKQTPTRNQQLEVETLKTSLAHAHRMVSNLRSNLHREKTEKFELKKLLTESQETIEQLQNDPRLWVDAGYPKSSTTNGSADQAQAGRRNRKTKRRVPVSKTRVTRPSRGAESLEELFELDNNRRRKDSQAQSSSSASATDESDSEYDEDDDDEDAPAPGALSDELSKHAKDDKKHAADAPRSLGDELSAAFSPSPAAAEEIEKEKPASSGESHADAATAAAAGALVGAAATAAEAHVTKPVTVEVSTQTDEAPATPTVEQAAQTDAPEPTVLSDHTLPAFDVAPRPSHDQFVQCDAAATHEIGVQCMPTSTDAAVQYESQAVESSTQCEVPEGITKEVQHSPSGVDQGTEPIVFATYHDAAIQSDAPKVHDVSVQCDETSDASAAGVAGLGATAGASAVDDGSKTKESSAPSSSIVGAIGAGALGLGALASRAFGRNNETTDAPTEAQDPASAVAKGSDDASGAAGEQNPKESSSSAAKASNEDSVFATVDASSATLQASTTAVASSDASSTEKAADTTNADTPLEGAALSAINAADSPETPRAERSQSASTQDPTGDVAVPGTLASDSMDAEASRAEADNIDQNEDKLFTKAETDALVAAAVADALKKAREQDGSQIGDDEDTKRHTCDMTSNTAAVGTAAAAIAAGAGAAAVPHRPSLADLAARSPKTDSDVPVRPSSPPPAHLLSRVAHTPSIASSTYRSSLGSAANSIDKGKTPIRNDRGLFASPLLAQQNGRPSQDSAPSASSISTSEPRPSTEFDTSSFRSDMGGDPSHIALITQTMIGDWLWKYTRNPVGGTLSDRRHKRYFWIHPYTRTLYWSHRAPGTRGSEAKAKSACIEGVQAVPEHASSPAGLPGVSLLIKTTNRAIKLTAPSMARHNIWFEALTYLLSRGHPSSLRMDTKRSTENMSDTHSGLGGRASILRTPSLQRLFHPGHKPQPSVSTPIHFHSTNDSDDSEDEALEDVRMCCDGRHHVSKLERDRIHHRPYYPKRKSRHHQQQQQRSSARTSQLAPNH
ncbi:hypothetical protein BCR43DRAFT_561170 [Syncephalastrum racemosum]|uniref:PH domain-containing protein n=1 Tax=Syncephalastrum racemosum TaxID=13706 RepID=A0A1X2HMY6_SYNRA|nr:hypothetical protein BCR43DRAFT_561170 [Syncephalastrum racemosum]